MNDENIIRATFPRSGRRIDQDTDHTTPAEVKTLIFGVIRPKEEARCQLEMLTSRVLAEVYHGKLGVMLSDMHHDVVVNGFTGNVIGWMQIQLGALVVER